MATHMRNCFLAGLLGLLVACGGGGGGNRATGVEPGPPPPGGSVPPPPPEVPETSPSPYAQAEELLATITSAALNDNNQAVVDFQLTDGRGLAITDLVIDNIRFVIAKLQGSPLGNFTGTWQSYINDIEIPTPGVGPATDPKLQADSERDGEFTNNGDGTYSYVYATSLTDLDQTLLDQAASEGLDLGFEPDRTHRVVIQFDGNPQDTANPHYDWVPATGATVADGIFTMDIAATANCNRCHDPLGIHGGNRREVKYCVNCHNAGSTDANSGNTVDMKVMIHKIHMGENLPSVQAGGEYAIWGFGDRKHDYSGLVYPQDIRNCVNCHVGTAGSVEGDGLVPTDQGDNWAEVPTRTACGSCHDDVNFDRHAGGNPDDSRCASCHSATGPAGTVQFSHRIELEQARETLLAEILHVDNSMPGEQAAVTFTISNPQTGEPYDLKNDPIFTADGARLAIGVAWNTVDYTNTGNQGDNASQVQNQDVASFTENGNGSYTAIMPVAIPDGSLPPGVAASGSGVATVEGHPIIELDQNNDGTDESTSVPVGDARKFFSIDEADGEPKDRRVSVKLDNCLTCHSTLILHGSNRADNIDSCVSCHNPRNTDKRVRETAINPPTDGKDEESLDFKTMVHGIHAPSIRENALQIVGFGGFSTHVYDEEHVHYPGDLSNCVACHTDAGFRLPLATGVLGTTTDTGDDRADPADDVVTTPETAVCASCHDDSLARAHMEQDGNGSFNTTQAAIDSGEVVETCSVCHGTGRSVDAAVLHGVD